MNKKVCPMKFRAVEVRKDEDPMTYFECDKETCAWWVESKKWSNKKQKSEPVFLCGILKLYL